MKNVLFSIIVPIYNKASFLKKCLFSLQQQDFHSFEVLCIDDCSTDASCEIVEEFLHIDNRFILIKNEENLGVSNSRNIGIESARGKWLLFVDADDYLSEDALSLLYYSVLDKKSCDMVLFNGKFDNGKGCVSGDFFDDRTIGGIPEKTLFCVKDFDRVLHYVNAAVACIRREFLYKHSISFTPNMRHEDWEFMWHVFAFNPQILYLPENLYFYVHDSEGYSSSKRTIRQSLDLFKAFEIGRNYFISQGIWNDVEYSAILVAIRHFWDFLKIKVCECDDLQFKLLFAYTLQDFLLKIPDTLFLSIVSNPRFLANKKTVIQIRNCNSEYKMLWIVNKISQKTRLVADELKFRVKSFFYPFVSVIRWGVQPVKCFILLLKYINYQLVGMQDIKRVAKKE